MRRRFKIAAAGAGALLVFGAGFVAAVHLAPLPAALNDAPPRPPVLVDLRGKPFAVPGDKIVRDSQPLSLREMGEWLPFATVAIEDHRFWEHRGVDWHAMAGAALRNARNLRVISGASTITQQTIKLATGRSQRTLDAKIREAFAAQKLEQEWDKSKILEAYLNRLDYGNRRIGPEAAARAYFGKSVRDLTLPEAIYLAGLPQSPTRLNPWRNPQRAWARYQLNVGRLAKMRLLPEGISESALLAATPQPRENYPSLEASHFADLALERSGERSGIISTTLDANLQRVAETMLSTQLRLLGGGDAAIVVVENATGEVRALASGGSARHRAINAANVPRSCGSSLKPFVYLAAIERRQLTAASWLPDTEQAIAAEYQDYDPQNYTKQFYGPVRVREALGNSMNVPAVIAVSQLGARAAFRELQGWGFEFPRGFDDYGAGFILGNADIRLIDLAGAYAGLARGGLAWRAKVLVNEPIYSERMASAEACTIVTDILCDNEARRLSFGLSSPLNVGARVAVKTGTSSGFRDRWCVGFNRQHTVAVWSGNLDGKPLDQMLAVRAAGPLWAAMMRHLLATGDEALPEPVASEKLQPVEVAAETGLLPRPGEKTIREWFLDGTAPTENAAGDYGIIDGIERLLLPPEYQEWCASSQNRLGAVARSGELRILFPRDGASFIVNPNLSPRQQTLHFTASEPDCRWLLNGREVNGQFQLERGDWKLSAQKAGISTSIAFKVE